MDKVKYTGSCHCGQVKFEVLASSVLNAIDCSCSICTKKQNRHVIVPSSHFKLIAGHQDLTTYTFNTHQAKHMFCSKCGVQSFYIPRSNPDGIGFMPHCIDDPKPKGIIVEEFDGIHWEETMKANGTDLSQRSKDTVASVANRT